MVYQQSLASILAEVLYKWLELTYAAPAVAAGFFMP